MRGAAHLSDTLFARSGWLLPVLHESQGNAGDVADAPVRIRIELLWYMAQESEAQFIDEVVGVDKSSA